MDGLGHPHLETNEVKKWYLPLLALGILLFEICFFTITVYFVNYATEADNSAMPTLPNSSSINSNATSVNRVANYPTPKVMNSVANSNTNSDTTSDATIPPNSVVEGLIKETISEFRDAVTSGDFSGLHKNASKDFRSTYTVNQMETAFKSYTDKKSMVVPIFEKAGNMTPDFTAPVEIRSEQNLKILMAKGEFNTKPFKVRYDFEYVMRGGEWKLLKLVINVP